MIKPKITPRNVTVGNVLWMQDDYTWRELTEPWQRLRWARKRWQTLAGAVNGSAEDAAASLGMKPGTYRAYERAPETSKATQLDHQAACSKAILYIQEEFPMTGTDMFVKTDDGAEYRVRKHATKSKFLIQASVAAAVPTAVVTGATMGAVSMYPVGPEMQSAARVYVAQHLPGCQVTNGLSIDGRITWEFEYSCDAPVAAPAAPKRAPRAK